jgi:MacB-like periplasmic core domain
MDIVTMSRLSSFEALCHDVRFGWRALARNRSFTVVAVLTLALGVGANTAILSIVKAVLLDPLPYAEPNRLLTIAEAAAEDPENQGIDYTTVRDLRERSRSFERISAYRDDLWIFFCATTVGESR